MKKVNLLIEECNLNGEFFELNYKEQLIGFISNPAEGMNLVQMRNVEKVYDKLYAADCPGSVLLEDAEHATLKAALETTKFRVFNKEIKQMVESVVAAESVNMTLLKDSKTG